VYVLHTTTTTKTVDGISGTCIVLQAGLWKQWAQSFRDFGNYFKKVSKILEVVGHSVQNFGNFWTKFEQLWNCSHKQGFQCTMEAKNSFNNGAMVQKSSFQIKFLFAKLSNTTIVREKVDFLEMMQ